MSDYTPDEEQVREQYTQEQPPQVGSVEEKRAEFDRFLAKIKAEAVAEAMRGFTTEEREAQEPTPARRFGRTEWDNRPVTLYRVVGRWEEL